MAASAVPAIAGETIARSLPSLAMVSGSRPRISQAPRTPSCTGMARSSSAIETSEPRAISFKVVATPPRVGSFRQWMPSPAAARSAATRVWRGAVSLSTSVSISSASRASMMAMACSVYAKGCCVIHGIEQGVREGGREDAFNEVVGGFAATAMAERDFLVAQIEFVTTCLPCALDLFEDVVDACIIHRYSWLSLQRRNTENRRNGRRDAIHCALWEGSTPLVGALHCAPTSTCFSHMFLLN